MNTKTVYIAGPVTNDPDYKWKFARAQSRLERRGYKVVNPVSLAAALPVKEKEKIPKDKKRVDHGKVNALHKAGWSAAKIADEMGISVATVYNHIDKEK